jgi:hypothetical protein
MCWASHSARSTAAASIADHRTRAVLPTRATTRAHGQRDLELGDTGLARFAVDRRLGERSDEIIFFEMAAMLVVE